MAYDANRGPPCAKRQAQSLRSAQEVQAFFLQHAIYDLESRAQSPDVVRAIALHRRAETLSAIMQLEKEFDALDLSKNVRKADRLTETGFALLEDAYELHSDEHGAAYFIGCGLWNLYKTMSTGERVKFLSTLYPASDRNPATEGIPPLETLLALAGVRNEDDLNNFLKKAGSALMQPVPGP
jgi:hypothetical protein